MSINLKSLLSGLCLLLMSISTLHAELPAFTNVFTSETSTCPPDFIQICIQRIDLNGQVTASRSYCLTAGVYTILTTNPYFVNNPTLLISEGDCDNGSTSLRSVTLNNVDELEVLVAGFKADKLEVTPNPIRSTATIKYSTLARNDAITINLISSTGSLVAELYTGELNGEATLTQSMDLSSYPDGMYFIQTVTASGKVYTKRVLIGK